MPPRGCGRGARREVQCVSRSPVGLLSDNGKSQAELYYHHVRPKEGLPRIYYPSTTTQFGTQFRRAAGML